jgi:hypothetical protein
MANDIIRFEERRLLNIEAALQLLAEAKTIEEVTEIRSYAEAVRLVARQAKAGLEAQNQAAELKLRAERRAGEMLATMERHQREDNFPKSMASTSDKPTLSDIGVTKDQSSNWQQIASIPESDFEQHIEETKSNGKELTTAGVMRTAKEYWQRNVPDFGDDYDAEEAYYRHSAKDMAEHVEKVAGQYKLERKSNYTPDSRDNCQTPGYALDPLLPFLDTGWSIWEPACGEGRLVRAFIDSGFFDVLATDISSGQDFFSAAPQDWEWDCIVTNPPFSLKYRWLERCYELGKPFALLLPVETLGAKTAQKLMQQHGFEIMLLDQRVDFRMPNKGWGGTSPFPVFWLTWQLLPQTVVFGSIENSKRGFSRDDTLSL